jgi:hypothetical protein
MITLDLAKERRLELRREARRSQSRLTDRARTLATRLRPLIGRDAMGRAVRQTSTALIRPLDIGVNRRCSGGRTFWAGQSGDCGLRWTAGPADCSRWDCQRCES